MRVLVADDSATMRLILSGLLSQIGVDDVSLAADGREALELLMAEQFDAVLLDIHMPEMDGVQLLQTSEAQRAIAAGTSFLVVSSDSSSWTIDKAVVLGARGHVKKPVQRDRLESALASAKMARDQEK